jgi:hypothetical protein
MMMKTTECGGKARLQNLLSDDRGNHLRSFGVNNGRVELYQGTLDPGFLL